MELPGRAGAGPERKTASGVFARIRHDLGAGQTGEVSAGEISAPGIPRNAGSGRTTWARARHTCI